VTLFSPATPGLIAPATAIIGGSPVVGDGSVVAVKIGSGGSCSGVLYAPRIVVTAAHCTTPRGGRAPLPASEFRVYPPGVDTLSATPVSVRQVIQSPDYFRPPTYTLQSFLETQAYDVAFLILTSDLAVPQIAGILTPEQVKGLVDSSVPVQALGYGCTTVGGAASVLPKVVDMPLRGVYQRRGVWVLEYRATTQSDTCAGDSGGPTLATIDGRRYLISVLTGGYTATGWQSVSLGPVVSAHPTLIAQATAAALVPVLQAAPVIAPATGTGIGGLLTATTGTWQHLPSNYTYQWQRCPGSAATGCTDIPGATSSSYTVTAADAGATIVVRVSAVNQNGVGTPAVSAGVAAGGGSGSVSAPEQLRQVCIKGPDVSRRCTGGARWTYAYCWDSPRARLERLDGGSWTAVTSVRGTRDRECRAGVPFLIRVSQVEERAGDRRYRVVVGTTADPFTVTAVARASAASPTPSPSVPVSPVVPASCAQGGACAIGDRGPGGGVVFYDAGAAQPWGRYLEVAPPGWAGAADPVRSWCARDAAGFGVRIPTSSSIGSGRLNTAAVIAQCGTGSAAGAAAAYQGGGRTDWFLPSRDEVGALAQQRTVTGLVGLITGGFWTSSQSENDIGNAWALYFDGDSRIREKHLDARLRPVRAF